MTAKKDPLGIQGVFASTSLMPGEDWRWQTHLSNVPIFYEIRARDRPERPGRFHDQNSSIRRTSRTSLTCTSTAPPWPRPCPAARPSTTPWRSSRWARPRWCKTATGGTARSPASTATWSRRKMSIPADYVGGDGEEDPRHLRRHRELLLHQQSSTGRQTQLAVDFTGGCTPVPPARHT